MKDETQLGDRALGWPCDVIVQHIDRARNLASGWCLYCEGVHFMELRRLDNSERPWTRRPGDCTCCGGGCDCGCVTECVTHGGVRPSPEKPTEVPA